MTSTTRLFSAMALCTAITLGVFGQKLPFVYDVENTGAAVPLPPLPALNDLPAVTSFPDPFLWADSSSRLVYKTDWKRRRAQIGAQIQHYEIGNKPSRPDTITASYTRSDSTLRVFVTENGQTLTLTSRIIPLNGTGPFPAVIGMNSPTGSLPSSIFTSRSILRITFSHNQVTAYANPQPTDPYFQLYPQYNPTNSGQYSAWAWGVSRIIDGLEIVKDSLAIDLKRLAVTGCSYAGKMALFAGAFDERIALTIAQESGGGGATSWRFSHSEPNGTVEKIDNTDYNWFMDSMKQFSGDYVSRLPVDHHELMGMVAPRALYVTGNPDYVWLSNQSCFAASATCALIYRALGVIDRFGYSIVGGHAHCQVPSAQVTQIEAFVDKFLLGKDTVITRGISDSPYSIDFLPWIPWIAPVLADNLTSVDESSNATPEFILEQNYPNPFNGETLIRYSVSSIGDGGSVTSSRVPSPVSLRIHDLLGREVALLVNEEKPPGTYSANWDATGMPSGVYFCRLAAGRFVQARKVMLLR